MKKYIASSILIIFIFLFWPGPKINVWELKNSREQYTRIVVLGDSLTTGYNIGQASSYPKQLSDKVGQPIEVFGFNGITSVKALERVKQMDLGEPALWIVTLGGNDILKSRKISETESSMQQIFQILHGKGHTVVWTEVLPLLGGSDRQEMYFRLAEQEGVFLVPDILDDILTDPKLQVDAVHPNAKGCELIALRVHRVLVESLGFPDNK